VKASDVVVAGAGAPPRVRTGDVSMRFKYPNGIPDFPADLAKDSLYFPTTAWGYAFDKYLGRRAFGNRKARQRAPVTVGRGRAVLRAAERVATSMLRNATTGELGGWRTELKEVCFSREAAVRALSAPLHSFFTVLSLFGFDKSVISVHEVNLKQHAEYIFTLLQRAKQRELRMFMTEGGNPLANSDYMRIQDVGRVLDIWNACRVDCQFTTSARFRVSNWSSTFKTDFDYMGTGDVIRMPRGASDELSDVMSTFDAQAARDLTPPALLVYKALLHRRHPTAVPTKWGTMGLRGGGFHKPFLDSPLDVARYWLAQLGELSDVRWSERPVMLKQDKAGYSGERFAVGGVAQIS
jgi:hypothetical protein